MSKRNKLKTKLNTWKTKRGFIESPIWLAVGLAAGLLVSCDTNASEVVPPPYHDMQNKPLSTLECHTVNLYHESRSESDLANFMIMSVVENRVNDIRHKSANVCDVVFYPKAFSWTHDGKSDKIVDTKSYQRLYKLAEQFLLNKDVYVSMSEGSDHYHTVGLKTNWNYRVLDYIGQVDNHVFFRWKR